MSKRIPTQQDIRDQGRCGHGYRPSDGDHCGQPSEPDAPFGDCPGHAAEFREMVEEIEWRSDLIELARQAGTLEQYLAYRKENP